MSLSIKSNNNAPASRYLEVRINEQNHTFSLIVTNNKPNSALSTLETIKRVFAESFAFSPTAGDEMTQEGALRSLREQANAIQQGYSEKASHSWIARNFKGKERGKIEQLNRSIQSKIVSGDKNLNTVVNHRGIGKVITGFLDDESIAALRVLNKQTYGNIRNMKPSQLRNAHELGYEGNSEAEAATYLTDLSHELLKLSDRIKQRPSSRDDGKVLPSGHMPFGMSYRENYWIPVHLHPNGKPKLKLTISRFDDLASCPLGRFHVHQALSTIAGHNVPPEDRRSNTPLIATLAKRYQFPRLSDGSLTRWQWRPGFQGANPNPDPAPTVSNEAAPAEGAIYAVD